MWQYVSGVDWGRKGLKFKFIFVTCKIPIAHKQPYKMNFHCWIALKMKGIRPSSIFTIISPRQSDLLPAGYRIVALQLVFRPVSSRPKIEVDTAFVTDKAPCSVRRNCQDETNESSRASRYLHSSIAGKSLN